MSSRNVKLPFMTINPHKCIKLSWGCLGLGLGLVMTGCSSSSEVESPPPTAEEIKAAQALVTPAPQFVAVRYRVKGVTGQLTGQYTGASGADVPISSTSAGATWETTVSIPLATMRSQEINLSAQTASRAPVTVEIWADGALVGSRSGQHPLLSIRKH